MAKSRFRARLAKLEFQCGSVRVRANSIARRLTSVNDIEWDREMDFTIVNAWMRDENTQCKFIDLFATVRLDMALFNDIKQ